MKSSKKLFTVVVLVFCLSVSILSVYFAFFQKGVKYVSAKSMNEYAQNLISNYGENINFFLSSSRNNFPFYSNGSYTVKLVVSSTYGVAVLLNPSVNLSFENVETEQRVEESLFGGNLSETWPMFEVPSGGHDIIIEGTGSGGFFETNGHPFIELGDKSAVLIKNITVNSILYPCVILKGSNETIYWNTETAKNDSRLIFDSDLVHALDNSEEVRERYAEPELTALLQNVLTKWQSQLQSQGNLSYSYLQKEEDIKQIEDLAKNKYHITNSSAFINGILDYLEKMALPPAKTIFLHVVNDPDNWLYVGLLGGLPVCIYATYLVFNYLRNKYPSKRFRYMLGLPLSILVLALGDLVLYYPYDYQFFSIQTLVIIIIWLVGIFTVYYAEKRLILWRVTEQNKANDANNNPKQETEKHNKTKKSK